MANNRSFDEVWEELKNENKESREVFQTAEDTARIINELSEERIRQGLSQRQLAERCGLKQSAIARMESVQSVPRLDTLIRVANALNLKLEVTSEAMRGPVVIVMPEPTDKYYYCPYTSSAFLKIS